jgi:hypothetical protein
MAAATMSRVERPGIFINKRKDLRSGSGRLLRKEGNSRKTKGAGPVVPVEIALGREGAIAILARVSYK